MQTEDEKLVLIDTDAGTDDALAILMCLQAHKCPSRKFRVAGIVCVNGNTKVDHVTSNVTRLLELAEVTDIPLFRGCQAPLLYPYEDKMPPPPFHGYDGFGDVFPKINPQIQSENGVLAIIRLAHEYKGRLTILALGPLTNLGMAVRLDPTIKDCVREIYGMGGNVEGVGNTTVSGEFNFVVDPEAAFITLSSYACPIYIVPWEVCLRQGTRPLDWRRDVLGKVNSEAVHFLNQIEAKIIAVKESGETEYVGWIPCDQLAAAALIESSVIKKSVKYHCTVELSGNHTRGLMVVDYPLFLNQRPNVTIISEIFPEILEKLMLWGVGG